MRKALIIGAIAAIAVGCTTNPYTGEKRASRAATSGAGGAAAGAAAGAIAGAIVGGNAGKGALIGAGAGAAIGTGIGVYQDRQQAKLRERLLSAGVQVQRDGDNIYLIMPSDITFAVNQSDIKPGFYQTLNAVAEVFDEFDKTTITVGGHADSTGPEEYNLKLSQQRALSVSNYLAAQGVAPARLRSVGFGESRPIADNATESGRSANRRVEITIDPIESQF